MKYPIDMYCIKTVSENGMKKLISMKRILLLILCCLAVVNEVQAQKLVVESMAASPTDISASQYMRKDLNGNPCALVKVQLAAEGAKFEGNIIKPVDYKTGEYWVYMTEGSYMLSVKHPNFLPLRVNFRDYDISSVEGKATYEMILLIPQGVSVVENKDESFTFTVNGVSFNMIYVEGGTFHMGATSEQGSDAEKRDLREKPVHQVTLSPFYIGETEVTQELWKAVMGSNPSNHKSKNHPVENVNWNDCQGFISKLNAMTGKKFRLPTEAEWEYAARGGKSSKGYKYSGGNEIDKVAWSDNNSWGITHDVGLKSPNELRLYDMSGNVYEWCQDWCGDYSSNSQTNPLGPLVPSSGSFRVFRGGGCSNSAWYCRVSNRDWISPDNSFSNLGLRLALSFSPSK